MSIPHPDSRALPREGNATVEKASDAIMQICIEDDSKVYLFNWTICVRMNRCEPRQLRTQKLRAALSELSAKLDEWLDGKSEDEAPIFDAADLAAQVARDLRRRASHRSFAPIAPNDFAARCRDATTTHNQGKQKCKTT